MSFKAFFAVVFVWLLASPQMQSHAFAASPAEIMQYRERVLVALDRLRAELAAEHARAGDRP